MVTSDLDLADHWQVIEAVSRGVCRSRLSDVAPDGWYKILRPPAGVEPMRTVAFARGELGDRYGFLTIASIAVNLLPPRWLRWPIRFRTTHTWICSALGMEAVGRGGWFHSWPTIYGVYPSEGMHALLASGATEVPLDTARPGDLGFSHNNAGIIPALIRWAQRKTPTATCNHMFVLERFIPTPITTLHPPLLDAA